MKVSRFVLSIKEANFISHPNSVFFLNLLMWMGKDVIGILRLPKRDNGLKEKVQREEGGSSKMSNGF